MYWEVVEIILWKVQLNQSLINKAKNQSWKKGEKGEEGRRNIPKMPLESPVQDAPYSAIEYFVQS